MSHECFYEYTNKYYSNERVRNMKNLVISLFIHCPHNSCAKKRQKKTRIGVGRRSLRTAATLNPSKQNTAEQANLYVPKVACMVAKTLSWNNQISKKTQHSTLLHAFSQKKKKTFLVYFLLFLGVKLVVCILFKRRKHQ